MKPVQPNLPVTPRSRQAGAGLIELMIGLAISLVLVLGVTILFLQQSKSYSTQDEMSQLVESASVLAQVFTHDAQHAGFLGPSASMTVNTFGTATIVAGTNDSGPNSSDSVTFRYFGSVDPGGAVDGAVVDCQGRRPSSGSTVIVDTFYVAADPANNNEPSLYCNNGVAAVVLVPGVESVQVLYGEDTTGAGSITRFVPANIADMSQVRGMLISAVLRSPTNNHLGMANTSFNHFGATYAPGGAAPAGDAGSVFVAPTDKRIRKSVRFMVGVRNRLD
jgi:type IV pilus assembly protein PilW